MTAPRAAAWVACMALAALVLVGCSRSSTVRPDRAQSRPATTRPAAPVRAPRPGETVTVKRGDTLYRIATRFGLSPLDVAMWNRIPAPYTIYPGQRLRLTAPDGRTAASGGSGTAPVTRPPTTPPPVSRPPSGGTATSGGAASRPPVNSPAPAPVSSPFTWRWPADGALVSRYAAGDPTRQGIGIGGQSGAPVRAAADGVVVYSGAGLVGYGELVIIKHDDQWLSAYGHNRARLVNEGQRVKAGEQIAEMGRTGAARDMLHFEVRFNGRPLDPLQFLPKR